MYAVLKLPRAEVLVPVVPGEVSTFLHLNAIVGRCEAVGGIVSSRPLPTGGRPLNQLHQIYDVGLVCQQLLCNSSTRLMPTGRFSIPAWISQCGGLQ